MAVTYQASGSQVAATATTSVNWPTHVANDIGILVLESNSAIWTAPSGWTLVNTSDAISTELNIYWKRAASSSESATSTGFPTGADHIIARIITFRGCATTGSPILTTATSTKLVTSTAWSSPSITTTTANEFVVYGVARDFDSAITNEFGAPVNANLVSLVEIGEAGTSLNNGGGFVIGRGVKTTAGATGTTTGTLLFSAINASITFSLAAAAGAAYQLDVTTGSFTFAGNDLNLNSTVALNVTVGSFVLNGIANELLKSSVLNSALNTFTFTGNDLILNSTVALNVAVGSFALTGISSILEKQIVLNNTTGTFLLAGIDLSSAFTYAIIGNTGPFLIEFKLADVAKNFQLVSSTGTYTLTGISSDAVKNYPIVALPQSYVVGTTDLNYFSTRRLETLNAPFVMTLQSNGDFFWYRTTQTIPIIKPFLTNRNQWILGRATHMGRRGL